MNPKNILILDGHPAESSLSRTFARKYAEAARAKGHDKSVSRVFHNSDKQFRNCFRNHFFHEECFSRHLGRCV